MVIDPIRESESLMTLREVATMAKVNVATVRLWTSRGLHNNRGEIVKLRTIKVGAIRKTSSKMYRRFVRRMSLEPVEEL